MRELCLLDGYISDLPADSDLALYCAVSLFILDLLRGLDLVPSDDGITSSPSWPLMLLAPDVLCYMMKLCKSGMLRVPRRSADKEAFGLSTVCLNQPTS